MHELDAALNGVAFLALLVGLAIGWWRSAALRETLKQLFIPTRRHAHKSASAVSAHEADRISITWRIYQIEEREGGRRSRADDAEAFNDLRNLVRA